MHAAAIVMPMAQDGSGFGRALATVLRERPCRVIIESMPRRQRSARLPWRRSLRALMRDWRVGPGALGRA